MHEAHRISTIGSKRQRDARGCVAEEGREGLRKVPWRHLLHENLTGLEKMLHHLWGHGFHGPPPFSQAGGRAFQEAADDV